MNKFEETTPNNFSTDIVKKEKSLNEPRHYAPKKKRASRRKRCIGSRGNNETIKASRYSFGKWTKEEHDTLMFALDILGSHWKALQLFMGTRTCNQIRSHVQKYYHAVRRDTIKLMEKQNQLQGKPFIVIKQYLNHPFRCMLTKTDVRKVEELKKKWFSLQGKEEFGATGNENFDLPPLGNLAHEDKPCQHMQEIQALEFQAKPSSLFDDYDVSETHLNKSLQEDYKFDCYNPSQLCNPQFDEINFQGENHQWN